MPGAVRSLTERALLSELYLGHLYPSNCQEVSIAVDVETTVLAALGNPSVNFYASKPIRVCWVPKTLRGVGRLVYGVAVMTTVSPIGAVYHGAKAGQNLLMLPVSANKGERWEQVKNYAKEFFTDLIAAGVGLTCVVCIAFAAVLIPKMYLMATGLQQFAGAFILHGMTAWGAVSLSGATQTNRFIPWVAAWSDRAQGMMIALSVRNQFGAVGPGGALLRYGPEDRLVHEYTSSGQEEWKNRKKLKRIFHGALREYFTLVVKSGLYAGQEDLLTKDRGYLKKLEKGGNDIAQVKQLRRLWQNVEFGWNVFQSCQATALYGGAFQTTFMRCILRKEYPFPNRPEMGSKLLPEILAKNGEEGAPSVDEVAAS